MNLFLLGEKPGTKLLSYGTAFCDSTRKSHINHASRKPPVIAGPLSPASVKTSVMREKEAGLL
jgi:hypothetical protein